MRWDKFLKCRIDDREDNPTAQETKEEQYCSWETLHAMRKYWASHGHQNVPMDDCSCEFLGTGKPPICNHQPTVIN
jgi:hypothetical protein